MPTIESQIKFVMLALREWMRSTTWAMFSMRSKSFMLSFLEMTLQCVALGSDQDYKCKYFRKTLISEIQGAQGVPPESADSHKAKNGPNMDIWGCI